MGQTVGGLQRWSGLLGTTALALVCAVPLADAAKPTALDALKRGYVAMEADDLEASRAAFEEALTLASTSELRFQALVALGSVESVIGDDSTAVRHLEQATELRPGRVEGWLALAPVYDRLERPWDAAAAVEKALRAAPDRPELYQDLGLRYSRLDRHGRAAGVFERGAIQFPADPEMRLGLAVARFHQRRYREAVSAFEAALEIAPDEARAVYGLALAHHQMGDRAIAEALLARLREMDANLADDLAGRLTDPRNGDSG